MCMYNSWEIEINKSKLGQQIVTTCVHVAPQCMCLCTCASITMRVSMPLHLFFMRISISKRNECTAAEIQDICLFTTGMGKKPSDQDKPDTLIFCYFTQKGNAHKHTSEHTAPSSSCNISPSH